MALLGKPAVAPTAETGQDEAVHVGRQIERAIRRKKVREGKVQRARDRGQSGYDRPERAGRMFGLAAGRRADRPGLVVLHISGDPIRLVRMVKVMAG